MQKPKKLKRKLSSLLVIPLSLVLSSCTTSSSNQNSTIDNNVPTSSLPATLSPNFVMRQKQAEKHFFDFSNDLQDEDEGIEVPLADLNQKKNDIPSAPLHEDPLSVTIAKGKFGGFKIIWPADGKLSSMFGMRHLRHINRMHTGIDISAPVGTRIYASAAGQILFSGQKNGYGDVVVISHDSDHETLYAHMSRILVHEGSTVRRGQVIGYVGKTGRVTGANLHYETRIHGIAYNPLAYLPPSSIGRMNKGMHTPSYAFQMEYYYKLNSYAYHRVSHGDSN